MSVFIDDSGAAIPIECLPKNDVETWLSDQDGVTKNWLANTGFKPVPGSIALIPDANGNLARVAFITGLERDPGFYAKLPAALPANDYKLISRLPGEDNDMFALGWGMHGYQFNRYKNKNDARPRLVYPDGINKKLLNDQINAICLTRDLINIPANDMTPADIAAAAEKLAAQFSAECRIIVGEDLLSENYPAVYAVGKASSVAPRLIDIKWGPESAPKVTLVGKGVSFDTGGLDIKDAGGMLIMKKDMGGAATVLGLASLIMSQNLPVRLRVLIPAVENAIAGNAFRPLDILQTRKGKTIEVGNTDAEGRLILSDALHEAAQDKPDLLLDFATLTGAARVALGPELPAMFCQQEELTAELLECCRITQDPMWPLPLWQGYRKDLESRVADLNNIAAGGFAGAIYAALFLQEFVEAETPWIHIDTYAWNYKARPGRPEGGEALGLRACFELIRKKFSP